MRVVQINHFSNKAAGSIMMNLRDEMKKQDVESYTVWGRGRKASNAYEYYMDDSYGVNAHALYTRITDRAGFASIRATKRLIAWLNEINPTIVHLHCVHGYYINLPLLFEYIKEKRVRIIWTQHDCWAFTGHCAYFDTVHCEKWKTGCYQCEQLNTYPKAFFDNTQKNWNDKNRLFNGLDATIVTPCNWLHDIIQQSFLKSYPINVIYNGIDTDVFKNSKKAIKNSWIDKKIILGVAGEWTERKGLNDFIQLNNMLDHDRFQIVIVGVTKKQKEKLPNNIIGILKTNNVSELVDIYSSADVFFNPTYEDNFPTTNIEAIACGTPVITYRTGGCPEAVTENEGIVVDKGDIMTTFSAISRGDYLRNRIVLHEKFTKKYMMKQYMQLYYG